MRQATTCGWITNDAAFVCIRKMSTRAHCAGTRCCTPPHGSALPSPSAVAAAGGVIGGGDIGCRIRPTVTVRCRRWRCQRWGCIGCRIRPAVSSECVAPAPPTRTPPPTAAAHANGGGAPDRGSHVAPAPTETKPPPADGLV